MNLSFLFPLKVPQVKGGVFPSLNISLIGITADALVFSLVK